MPHGGVEERLHKRGVRVCVDLNELGLRSMAFNDATRYAADGDVDHENCLCRIMNRSASDARTFKERWC